MYMAVTLRGQSTVKAKRARREQEFKSRKHVLQSLHKPDIVLLAPTINQQCTVSDNCSMRHTCMCIPSYNYLSEEGIHEVGYSDISFLVKKVFIHSSSPTLKRCTQTQVAVKYNLIGTTLQTLVSTKQFI